MQNKFHHGSSLIPAWQTQWFLHKIDEFPDQMKYFINFEKFFKQKYALLISFAEYYGFPETEIFFSENLLFALYNEV